MMMTTNQLVGRMAAVRASLLLLGMMICASAAASAQALPAAEAAPITTGFALPTSLGSLQYAVSASQSFIWGYYGNSGVSASTNLSGDLAYLSNSKQHPFSMVVAGGHSFGEWGEPAYSFVSLGASQVANIGKWSLVFSDNVNYLPGTAASGLSGVPGVGDLGVTPTQIGGDTPQGVLTNFSDRVSNTVAVSVSRQLTGKTSLNASGAYSITRFLDSALAPTNVSSGGLDNDSETGGLGISHQVDARNTYGGQYAYSNYTYTNNTFGIVAPGFSSQSVSAVYSHRFSRKLLASISAGPQFTTIQTAASVTSANLFVDASLSYAGKSANSSLSFVRSTNNGYGTLGGSLSNGAIFAIGRQFGVVWNVAATSSFTQTSSLPAPGIVSFSSDTYVEGVQISRAIMRSLSGFASYTFEKQSTSGTGAIDVYSGNSQILGFGITYSPSSTHLGHP
jgi:hypothetical protein